MNVVFLIADDLNDAIGCMRGPAKTPNIDRFAESAILFDNASCPVPLCNPSRTALLTGLAPWKTGIYNNVQFFRNYKNLAGTVTLPQHFKNSGFFTTSAGKIFHQPMGPLSDPVSWDVMSNIHPGCHNPINQYSHGFHDEIHGEYFNKFFDASPTRANLENSGDFRNAVWSGYKIKNVKRPFFVAYGSFRPHLPWYVPQEFFDLYDLDEINLPKSQYSIIESLSQFVKSITSITRWTPILKKHNALKKMVQGYYASVSFADACFGEVFESIESSGHLDDTIVVLTSDHGWHLGEKQNWSKFKPWERSARVPLLIRAPGIKPGVCKRPVSSVDIYPTLLSLMGMEPPHELDGEDLTPFMKNTKNVGNKITFTVAANGKNFVSMRNWRYRCIFYRDGSTELYDMIEDPDENVDLSDSHWDVVDKFKANAPRLVPPIEA